MTVDRRRYPGSAHFKPQLSLCWYIQLDQLSMKVGQNVTQPMNSYNTRKGITALQMIHYNLGNLMATLD
uniref:Transposase n=1 Tax=Heterorhabditis bacteriophora TaxID=37862 RepID=A0A1I7WSL6_HETBA